MRTRLTRRPLWARAVITCALNGGDVAMDLAYAVGAERLAVRAYVWSRGVAYWVADVTRRTK